jgi:dihydrodipicolinate synthase/N-acetylneuraminate lyase
MKKEKKYSGIVIPAVTPLTADLKLDERGVEAMFRDFRACQTQPFILGTTGESASLPLGLKKEYVLKASAIKDPGMVLYAGISSNCIEESVELAKFCFDQSVDVVAATLPSYYTLTPTQMKKYFETLADKIPGPLIIYNIPSTTHMSIPLAVIDELSYHDHIVGTKDSERSEERLKQSIALWADRPDFSHFLGWAAKSAEALIQGSDGLIPSTGNFVPALYDSMLAAVKAGDHVSAFQKQELSDELGDLYQKGRSLGDSLAALKVLMHAARLCERFVMPPLTTLTQPEEETLLEAMKEIIIIQHVHS